MSLNQSKFNKNESQFRKAGGGRSSNSTGGQHRSFSGGRGRGGGLGGSTTTTNIPNSSFKKNNNVPVRANAGLVNASDFSADTSSRSVENTANTQPSLHVSNATQSGVVPKPSGVAPKPVDASYQKSNRPLPKPPSSQSSSSLNSDSTMPSTPSKGDGATGFPLQFGSLSPGFMNGMQVPARTNSAPPNLDEQKRDQIHRDPPVAVPAIPLPTASKQELPKKDVSIKNPETQDTTNKKRDVHVSSVPPPTHPHKPSVLPTAGKSVPMPYHQSSVSMQFGGPTAQIQSQGMPIQMPLQMANPSQVPQQVFMPALQHPIMQPQGLIPHPQNLGYGPQLAQQFPPALGPNLGMNMSAQYNQQPPGKYASARKTVKITHPDTHEELRLDSRDGGVLSQPQPMSAYTASHSMGYYTNSYTSGPPFFPPQTSFPSDSAPSNASSQGPRFNYAVSQAPPTMSFGNQPASSTYSVSRPGAPVRVTSDSSNLDRVRDVHNKTSTVQSTKVPVTLKAVDGSVGKKVVDSNGERPGPVKISEPSAVSKKLDASTEKSSIPLKSTEGVLEHSATMAASIEESPANSSNVIKGESEARSMPISDVEKLHDRKQQLDSPHQVDGHSDCGGRQEIADTSKNLVSESQEAKPSQTLPSSNAPVSEAGHLLPVNTSDVPSDVLGVNLSAECPDSSESSQAHNVVDKVDKDLLATQSKLPLHENGLIEPSRDNYLESSEIVKDDRGGQVKTASETATESFSSLEKDATVNDGCSVSDSISSSGITDGVICEGNDVNSDISKNEAISVPTNLSDAHLGQEGEFVDNPRPSSSGSSSGASKTCIEPSVTKNRGKKKLKEILQKADAKGSTDLYMAYKGPQETKEDVAVETASQDNAKEEISGDVKFDKSTGIDKDQQTKPEFDNWEDATEISTLKLESSVKGVDDEEGVVAKKYSRDFLLTFSEQFKDLPEGFEITSDIADALMSVNIGTPRGDREHSSYARIIDRPAAANRPDRREIGTMGADRWNKQPGPYPSIRDPGMDLAYTTMAYRGVPGFNYGVLKNPRAQGPVPHAGGILSGPMHSVGYQGLQRNNSDADRWQRATSFNKGLMPSPQGPSQVMHKAENKYEIGKVSDEEQAKQRKLKSILNKLTPQNFEKLFEQVKEVHIDNVITLTGVISQIFDKALMEPTFCEMYANFCYHLASELPELTVDDEKITFRRLLLNTCQEEFERGEREEQEASKTDNDSESETKQSEAEREEMRLKARRRMLGNIRLIGELYKKRMLTERIMHECIKKLLGDYQNPDEENIEALCKLMSTIGEMIDHQKAKEHMDAYFDIMSKLSNDMRLSSRLRFMLKDAIDLRKNKWQQRMKVEGPKKIEDVHRDAAQERQGQAARLSRGPSMNSSSIRRGQPMEFGPRGTMLPSQIGQGGGSFRGMAPQVRGFETRTLSMTLPQRISSDEPITLGPQGGLARNMVYRGQPSMSSSPLLENAPSYADPRRIAGGLNGHNNVSERGPYSSSRDEQFVRNSTERYGAPSNVYDQYSSQEVNANRDVRYSDRSLERVRPITPPVSQAVPAQNTVSETVYPEERLREMSIAAIREYYSAKDEKEVALCIRDLNSPSFYPTVVSTWVTDSFERKDLERELLSKLLVNLARPGDGIFSSGQLVEGLKTVLSTMEDTVTDAPKAPQYLGRMFGRVIIGNIVSLEEVGQMVKEGGEEPGSLREAGLAGEIIGSVLEMIKEERGESVLKEIRARSNLRLEDFRPPGSFRCHKLEMFI